jgi:hypothetical protein
MRQFHFLSRIGFSVACGGALLVQAALGSAPAQAQQTRSTQIVLDLSSSMLKRVENGDRKVDEAKEAVRRFFAAAPLGADISLRAYGHQSPERQRDCRDTEQVASFTPMRRAKTLIPDRLDRLSPRGYSPISLSLRRAERDVDGTRRDRDIIVLVSDGKETCSGDPCATARRLTQGNPSLTIHTIGFSIDGAARAQMQCIARVGRGQYFDAPNGDALARQLQAAYSFEVGAPTEVVVVAEPKPGRLTMRPAGKKHLVRSSESGEIISALNAERNSSLVPPGIYSVSFGNGVWRSVEVAPGKETVLRPGRLIVRNASSLGHAIVDAETNKVIDEITAGDTSLVLMPDTIMVQFGRAVWRDVVVPEGEQIVLNPGVIEIRGAEMQGTRMPRYRVFDGGGQRVAMLSLALPRLPLPPGDYTVDVHGRRVPVSLTAGEVVALRVND